ncbi:MAG: hypothetical protein HLUCCO07_08680 [Rhodobacteraceae bacterium HLUCCO07]|nr:MAG: hypothetical protein HLUCCO07_08680 [Rhodobacteraceae bacterium HLUCCO07]
MGPPLETEDPGYARECLQTGNDDVQYYDEKHAVGR